MVHPENTTKVHQLVVHLSKNVWMSHCSQTRLLTLDCPDWVAIHKNQHEIWTISHYFDFFPDSHLSFNAHISEDVSDHKLHVEVHSIFVRVAAEVTFVCLKKIPYMLVGGSVSTQLARREKFLTVIFAGLCCSSVGTDGFDVKCVSEIGPSAGNPSKKMLGVGRFQEATLVAMW